MPIRYTESGDEFYPDGDNFCELFSPEVDTLPVVFNHNETKSITINGKYFTSGVEIEATNGLVINNVTFVDSTQIILDATSQATDTFHDVTIKSSVCETTIANFIETRLTTWVDLASGAGAVLPDVRNTMIIGQDVNGMYFTGSNPWSSWVKFNNEQWPRTTSKTLQWIFTRPNGAMMIGIGSTNTDENSGAQYAQAEVEMYFNSSTAVWGLYGNNGTPGSAGNMSSSLSIAGGTGVYKLIFEQNGSNGADVFLYELPTANPADWDNTATLLTTMIVGGSLNPAQPTIMPFIIPRSGGAQRFVAYKLGV